MNVSQPDLDVRALLRLADAAAKRGNSARAVALYEQVGDWFETRGFRLKAVAVWMQIVGLCPDRFDVRLRLAEGFAGLGLVKEARGELQRVMKDASAAGNRRLHDQAAMRLYTLITK